MIETVRADNPGPMTLTGTNTYVITDDRAPALVVDPGPDDARHLDRLDELTHGTVGLIVLTHRHRDHTAAVPALTDRWGCPAVGLDAAQCVGAAPLADGDRLAVGRTVLTVAATPGHTADSLCLVVTGDAGGPFLLSGDTVLGSGTTVIAAPDGDLSDYLRTLDRLADLVAREGITAILPGHGPRVDDPAERLAAYRRHREERLDEVRAALAAGAVTAEDVVDRVYPDLGDALRTAARQSAQAQLDYLVGEDGAPRGS